MHPGVAVRRDCLEKHGLSVTDAARDLGVDRRTLSNPLDARSGMSPELAVRLEKAFGTPAREWLMRQRDHELALVMQRAGTISVEPFSVPLGDGRSGVGAQGRESGPMNAVEIEDASTALAEQPFDAEAFPSAFLEAFGNKETTIRRLRTGRISESDLADRYDVGAPLHAGRHPAEAAIHELFRAGRADHVLARASTSAVRAAASMTFGSKPGPRHWMNSSWRSCRGSAMASR